MPEAHYLNVDLEIDSPVDLGPIAEDFGDDVSTLYCGEWGQHYRAAFEVAHYGGVNESLALFCTLIESLDDTAKALWDSSFSRVFDLGFESGDTASSCQLALEPSIVARVAAVGATLAVTVYPVSPEDSEVAGVDPDDHKT